MCHTPSSQSLLQNFAWFVLVILLTDLPCGGHCLPPGPPPAPPPPVRDPGRTALKEMVYPLRWSWLHWWEANRDPFLTVLQQGEVNQNAPAQIAASRPGDGQREKAVAALRGALASDVWRLRTSAGLALGQMGDAGARDALAALASSDRQERVRQSASIALGLLQAPDAQRQLLSAPLARPEDAVARLLGLGLLGNRDPNALQTIQQQIAGGAPPIAWAGLWALSQDGHAAHAGLLRDVLSRTTNAWVASEAMLGLGRLHDRASIPLLAGVLLGGERAAGLPAWAVIEARRQLRMQLASLDNRSPTSDDEYQQAYQKYLADHALWQQQNAHLIRGNQSSWDPQPPQEQGPPETRVITAGEEEIYQGYLRAAAAIALGDIDDPASRHALMQALAQRGDEWGGLQSDVWAIARLHEYSDLHKGMALMSLGRIGDESTLPILVDTLQGRIPTRAGYPPERMANSPLRGYAALALGLYARPVITPQGQVDRPRLAEVCKLLGQRAANPSEALEVRTACTLALGLSARTENLRYLRALGDIPKGADPVLRGYALLARALLGDRNIIKPADRFLHEPEHNEAITSVLGRRAAVLALGLLGTEEAIPILVFAWDQSYYVNREAALALALCRGYSVTDALIKLIGPENQPLARAFGARCLGELFARHPQPLAHLLNGSNYAMRNDAALPYRAIANEFLFYGLIPAFGLVWP